MRWRVMQRACGAALLLAVCVVPLFASARPAKDSDAHLEPAQLTANTFDEALHALPAGRAIIMEFYASWCPACQHFQPHYERVAAFFNAVPPPQPEVYVARVDCAKEARPEACRSRLAPTDTALTVLQPYLPMQYSVNTDCAEYKLSLQRPAQQAHSAFS